MSTTATLLKSTHPLQKASTIHFAIADCSLGFILIAVSDVGLCALMFGDDHQTLTLDLQHRFPACKLIEDDQKMEELITNIVALVEDPTIDFSVPLDIQGTPFQKKVWQAISQIPRGETASYARIAEKIGAPTAMRAVAQACGANKIAVLIPCHRVVRTDGALSGYRWGVKRKAALLERERAI